MKHTRPSDNLKVWVPQLSKEKLREIELTNCEDEMSLAKGLFLYVFQEELATDLDLFCCTVADGKQLLDQELLRGIRCKFPTQLSGYLQVYLSPELLTYLVTFTTITV